MAVVISNVVAIVNDGYSDLVMDIAKEKGARGGTVIPASGSVSENARKLYGIDVHPEKEIVLILVKSDIVNDILDALYDKAGERSDAKGIFFALPVSTASENLLKQYEDKKESAE